MPKGKQTDHVAVIKDGVTGKSKTVRASSTEKLVSKILQATK